MNNLADIKYRIKTISQTRQITGAMETISIAKSRKAVQRYHNNELFFNRLRREICDIAGQAQDISNKFLSSQFSVLSSDRRAVFIVIASDKGLTGGFNHNVLNFAWDEMLKCKERYIFTVGQMARDFFEQKKATVDIDFLHVTQNPSVSDAAAITESIIKLYEQGFMDEVYAVYTAMGKNSVPAPQIIKVLPIESGEYSTLHTNLYFDPSPVEVLDTLVPQYMTGLLYGCLVQSAASEHSSRAAAMANATRNAGEIIDRLNLVYNRARQESVTNEMLERQYN